MWRAIQLNAWRVIAPLAGLLVPLAGCGKVSEVRMTDPRTGISTVCQSDRFNLFTPPSARQEVAACVDELGFYGFRDDAALRAAHEPPPEAARPPIQAASPSPYPFGRATPPRAVFGPDTRGADATPTGRPWYLPD